ncbi:STAS domain-containing protein [Amycolatopsis sp. CA-128772]|uniref:STAS domain-containing protein n=1 Tax=Amycolatopsis sp. CA-128772 TaxID=2073159 RepID=UPI000CD216A6|nr:STAS domain-containing protein [Amycolatopsis sp. CA-128772]
MTDHRTAPRFDTTTAAGIVTVHCAGELDLGCARRLREVLLTPIHDGARGVVADLTETTFCDSTVFSVLAEAFHAAAARGVPYAIAAGEVAVTRPLQLLGLDRVLPLHPRLDAAHAAVGPAACSGSRTAAPAQP